jgi:Na+/H+ antiporter NhaD/arsenite permease-like protein
MASTLAGNLTVTGSIANIIVVETVRPHVRIRFLDYLVVGVPTTILTMAAGLAWITLFAH